MMPPQPQQGALRPAKAIGLAGHRLEHAHAGVLVLERHHQHRAQAEALAGSQIDPRIGMGVGAVEHHAAAHAQPRQAGVDPQAQAQLAAAQATAGAVAGAAATGFVEADPSTWGNPGRNDPCPCGSGEKFKHCHGKL